MDRQELEGLVLKLVERDRGSFLWDVRELGPYVSDIDSRFHQVSIKVPRLANTASVPVFAATASVGLEDVGPVYVSAEEIAGKTKYEAARIFAEMLAKSMPAE